MILDQKLLGVLDAANDCIILREPEPEDELYPTALEIFGEVNGIVDSLYKKASRLR